MTASAPSPSREVALGSSLPVLLEYHGRRWRISAGLLIEGLLLGAVLTVPLLFPDRFPAVQIAETSPPIWQGSWEGNPNVKKLGGGNQSKPDPKPRPDLDSIFFQPPSDDTPGATAVGTGPEIGNGSGNGEQRYGDPTGPEYSRPPDGPIRVASPNVPPPPDGVVDPRRYKLQPPRLLQRVEPAYPRLALAAHIEGDVVLTAIIETDGRVRQVTIKNGPPSLAPAAREAVEQWLYEPTTLNGQPVAVQLDVTVKFRLNR